MKRRSLVIAVIIVLVAAIAIAASAGYLSGKDKENYNVVEIYVLSWDLNTKSTSNAIDVQFRISIDSDHDGVYDVVRTSEVFHNTTVETAPFRVGGLVKTSVAEFTFKVEAFQVENGSLVSMNYLSSGVEQSNTGLNEVGFSQSWKYDATGLVQKDTPACRISFVCYVDSRT